MIQGYPALAPIQLGAATMQPQKGYKENKQLLFNLISGALGLLAHTEPAQVN